MTNFTERATEEALIDLFQRAFDASPRLPCKVMAHPGRLSAVAAGATCDAFVKYSSSDYERPVLDLRTGSGTQKRTPQFTLLLRLRNVSAQGAHMDAYEYLNRAIDAASGWALPGVPDAEAFSAGRDRLIDFDEEAGLWIWELVFTGAAHLRPYSLQEVI